MLSSDNQPSRDANRSDPLRIDLREFVQRMNEPGALFRFGSLPHEDQKLIAAEVAQFIRAENGDRARPDLLPDGLGYKPTPVTPSFAHPDWPRDTHRPDRTPEQLAEMRPGIERLQTEHMAERLQEQMGTDLDRPDEETTRRDQVEAALALYNTGD